MLKYIHNLYRKDPRLNDYNFVVYNRSTSDAKLYHLSMGMNTISNTTLPMYSDLEQPLKELLSQYEDEDSIDEYLLIEPDNYDPGFLFFEMDEHPYIDYDNLYDIYTQINVSGRGFR